jgi:5'-nucleotidase
MSRHNAGGSPVPLEITMLILLTNDDGIRAPGIAAALKVLRQLGDVFVVAPETVQSATGHGITIHGPLMTQEVPVDETTMGISVEGRPADCVKLAVNALLPRRPDLVVSGINSGANVGINVIYSGTVAAAIEGAFLGLPAIALSLLLEKGIPDYDHAADLCLTTIKQILACGISPGEVMSVNVPALKAPQMPRGTKVVRQCIRPWDDTYEKRLTPVGKPYFWNTAKFTLRPSEQTTDVAALRDGYVTVTPLKFDLTCYDSMKRIERAFD